MNVSLISIFLLLSISSFVHASLDKSDVYEGWMTKEGNIAPNTDSMKTIGGFGGWLIITPDTDWEAKWNTPSYVTPKFNEASTVNYGQKLTILTFFINPKISPEGTANISCGVKISSPDNTISIDQQNIECIKDVEIKEPRNAHLSPVVIDFVGEPGDPSGEWIVEININDLNRGAFIPLKSSFTLINEANQSLKRDGSLRSTAPYLNR